MFWVVWVPLSVALPWASVPSGLPTGFDGLVARTVPAAPEGSEPAKSDPLSESSGPNEANELNEPKAPEANYLARLFVGMNSLSLFLQHEGVDDVDYSPNPPMIVGATVGYKQYKLSFSFNAGSLEDTETFGETKYFDIAFDTPIQIDGHDLVAEVHYRRYKGFHVANTSSFDPSFQEEDPRLLAPELRLVSIGGSATYYFNPDLRHGAIFSDVRSGRRTMGSWTLHGGLGYQSARDSEGSIVPGPAQFAYGDQADLRGNEAVLLTLAPGYLYDWAISEHWFLTGYINAGAAGGVQRYQVGDEKESGLTFNVAVRLGFNAVYSGEMWHFGLFGGGALLATRVGQTDVAIMDLAVRAFGGARF